MTASAEPLGSEQKATQVSFEQVTNLSPLETQPPSLEDKQEDARWNIARYLVRAYLALLALSILIPMFMLWVPHVKNAFPVTDVRDLMLAMSGALSGLVGILGFVTGYYFKALDKSPGVPASSKKSKNE
jgi:hypothetical protein